MGLHTSVKAHINDKRVHLAVDTDTVHEHEEKETINTTFTEPQATDSVLETSMSMASTSYGPSTCDVNIPCLPMFSSAAKSKASYGNKTRAESLPPNGLNSSTSKVASVLVPSTTQTEGEILLSPDLKSFNFTELNRATRNFHPDNKVGDGGFGCVFKGWVDENSLTAARPGDGIVIAVKRMKQESFQGHMEWLKKIDYLGKLHHQNLVKLIGYCLEDDHRLLVYEFMPLGSLEDHLYGKNQRLSWNFRMKIALGAATALEFFHSNEAKVKYGSFNTSKILLDSNYNVKLCGYGFAEEWVDRCRGQVKLPWYEDRIIGFGDVYAGTNNVYAAPEIRNLPQDHLTPENDVYSFGVVLLEILSGRRALDYNRPPGEKDLVKLVNTLYKKGISKREVDQIFDAHMEGQYPELGAKKAVALVFLCLQVEPEFRPNMNLVVKVLKALQSPN